MKKFLVLFCLVLLATSVLGVLKIGGSQGGNCENLPCSLGADDLWVNAANITGGDLSVARLDLLFANNNLYTADQNIFAQLNVFDVNANSVQFNLNFTPSSEPEGLTWWNTTEHTLNISSGLGPVLQTGQETFAVVYNGTGSQIDDGEVIYAVGVFQGFPSIDLANAKTHPTISRGLGVVTMDIPDGTFGIASAFGKVRDLNTSGFSVDDSLWIDPDVNGGLTSTKPTFPDYDIFVGRQMFLI